MRDARIASTICGVSKPERIQQTLEWATWPINELVWRELMTVPFRCRRPRSDQGLLAWVIAFQRAGVVGAGNCLSSSGEI
jgi:hypothetical protein